MRQSLVPMILLVISGCSPTELLQWVATPEDQALAKSHIELLRQGQFEELERIIDPSLRKASLHDTLVKMAALIPPGEPASVTLVGANQMYMPGVTIINQTFEYDFSGKWVLANVALKREGANTTIVSFNVIPRPNSVAEQNKFTLSGKTPLQYSILTLAIILPLFTLFALVVCIRTKLRKRKWLWLPFIIVGFGKIAVNWTTGQWTWSLLSFQFFSASAFAPPYGPWTIAIAFPYGAMAFLLCRKTLKAPATSKSVDRLDQK